MKVISCLSQPLNDNRINGKSWMISTTIGDYLTMVTLEDNPYQRSILNLKYYAKLIEDLFYDTAIPPVSVVIDSTDLKIKEGVELTGKLFIIDGLQRTNCLMHCVDVITRDKKKGVFESIEDFKKKVIYVEVWEKIEFKNILYKMIVLNTGQKKMDYSHQLDILNTAFYEKLKEDGIRPIPKTEKDDNPNLRKNFFILADVTEGLVSFINRYPISGKKNAAEFLFERFNVGYESHEDDDSLKNVYDDQTYEYIKWILTTFSNKLDTLYPENNPLKKYNAFLIGFFASLGFAHNKDPEHLKKKIKILEAIGGEDPLKIGLFEQYYNKFKTGIGEKRRKYVYETFRDFFLSSELIDQLAWDETHERYFGASN